MTSTASYFLAWTVLTARVEAGTIRAGRPKLWESLLSVSRHSRRWNNARCAATGRPLARSPLTDDKDGVFMNKSGRI